MNKTPELHRQTITRQVGTRVYKFQVYHETGFGEDHYRLLWWSYEPIYGPGNHWLMLGQLSEDQMRVAWAHMKRLVRLATPERDVPFGHVGETWDVHQAWDRAISAAKFFTRKPATIAALDEVVATSDSRPPAEVKADIDDILGRMDFKDLRKLVYRNTQTDTFRRDELARSLKSALPQWVNEWHDYNSFTLEFPRTSSADGAVAVEVSAWKREHRDQIERVTLTHVGGSTMVKVVVAVGDFVELKEGEHDD